MQMPTRWSSRARRLRVWVCMAVLGSQLLLQGCAAAPTSPPSAEGSRLLVVVAGQGSIPALRVGQAYLWAAVGEAAATAGVQESTRDAIEARLLWQERIATLPLDARLRLSFARSSLEMVGGSGEATRSLRRRSVSPTERRLVVRTQGAEADGRGHGARGERWRVPVDGLRVTSPYGPRVHPITGQVGRMHHGIDYGGPVGTRVMASASGEVVASGWCGAGPGICVVIAHGGGWRSQYFHLSEASVRAGARVRQGEVIGRVGSTGSSTGPHLHFQVNLGAESVDPAGLLGRPVGGGR